MEVWVGTPYSTEWVWNLDMGWFGLVWFWGRMIAAG
jgi:hypothetical protein